MELNEKAKSRAQQRFFGMVRAAQKGEGAASPEVAKVAGEISKKDAKDFAKTKHKGLPEKKNVEEELTGDLKTDAERYRVPRGPGGNPKRIGDKVRSMSEKQPLGKLKIKYGAKKVRDYYKKNKAVDEGVSYGYKGKKYKKLPSHVKTPAGWGNDARSDEGKLKDAITDKLGITNTKKHGVLSNEDVTLQDANGNDFLEIIDLIKPDPIKKIANKFEENKSIIEEDVSYKEFTAKAREISSKMKKEKQERQKRNAESAYRDKVTKGVKFYDKKGKGHIKGGKKVYD